MRPTYGYWRDEPGYTEEQVATAHATYCGLTSVVDVMPTVLEMTDQEKPAWVEGTSLLSRMWDPAAPGRNFTVTTIPFANVGDPVRSVDDFRRWLMRAPATTVTVRDWSLVYSPEEGLSELYNLPSDPSQERNVIATQTAMATDVHRRLVEFMRATTVPDHLLTPRLELRI